MSRVSIVIRLRILHLIPSKTVSASTILKSTFQHAPFFVSCGVDVDDLTLDPLRVFLCFGIGESVRDFGPNEEFACFLGRWALDAFEAFFCLDNRLLWFLWLLDNRYRTSTYRGSLDFGS